MKQTIFILLAIAMLVASSRAEASIFCRFFEKRAVVESPFDGVETIMRLWNDGDISKDQAKALLMRDYEKIGVLASWLKPYDHTKLSYYGIHLRSLFSGDGEVASVVARYRGFEGAP